MLKRTVGSCRACASIDLVAMWSFSIMNFTPRHTPEYLFVRDSTVSACSKTARAKMPPAARFIVGLATLVACAEALAPGSTVAVVGASGNVGKLVALRLADTYKVHGIVRSAAKVRPFFDGKMENIELFEADLRSDDQSALAAGLAGAAAVVVCTGTTAFPTKAWSTDGTSDVTVPVLKAAFENKLDVRETIASLDAAGFNTPKNVDDIGTRALLDAWGSAAGSARERFIMMSSIGVQRRDQMPFPVLNACGVLDAKAAAEAALKADAKAGGYSYTVVRPGQLFGGPYDNNFYLGTLFELDKESPQDVQLQAGDTLVGDTLRSTLAEVIAQCLEANAAVDGDFSVVNVDGTPPELDVLRSRLQAV